MHLTMWWCTCGDLSPDHGDSSKQSTVGRQRVDRKKEVVRWCAGRCYCAILLLLLFCCDSARADSNGCDFRGSGLEQDPRGVQPVYFNCMGGVVTWLYPRAALRVIFKSPLKEREFRGCIRVSRDFDGARIFVEGHRSLVPLYSSGDGTPMEMVRCFSSYRGQAALYVEAESSGVVLKKQVASFEYDLKMLPKGAYYDPVEECSPCSEDDLLHYYCSSDYVAKGRILSVEDDPRLQRTTINFAASRVLHQRASVFRAEAEALNSVGAATPPVGRLQWPLHCGARAGPGEFLVLGFMRLGEAVLRCAARTEDWSALLESSGRRAQCVLDDS